MTNLEITSDQFTYTRKSRVFVAEASDLGWLKSIPEGFAMVSAKTGERVLFIHTFTMRDRDRDVQYWEYHPAALSLKTVPGCWGVSVRVLND
jgi:hypothetical protein